MELSGTIVLATDLSEASELAIQAAATLARRNDSEVTLLHCLDLTSLDLSHLTTPPRKDAALHATIEARLRELKEAHFEGVDEVNVEVVESRHPADGICAFAQDHDADMIVVGSHGRTGLTHFMLGSVAERVVRHAPCPVLVMRPKLAR